MLAFEHALRATQGARDYQEDSALIWPGAGNPAPRSAGDGELVAVLADGMGGHAGGAIASSMACDSFLSAFVTLDIPHCERLLSALERANGAIAAKVAETPALAGMGSTLIGAVFGDDGIEWVSVGDSPLLLWRRGELALLNEDHSLAPELDRMAEQGYITLEAARRDPRRHMLRSAVTGEDIELVDVSRRPLTLYPGDYVLLASDGLQSLEANEIGRIVAAYASDGPGAVADALIRAVEAVRDPHQDNTTVVAVRPVSGAGQGAAA